ncbi:14 kDa proline-rich protein DC2.15-like [Corylus avellana]|uniref:14 kDa proline-rich protein DC2.15-like n=1 Tax=Corylus avellana TaxID=13451 RepID=UPI001E236A82|nr:14 kDa proline-rich protein DC2.15-like [Corylus avellana]
MSSNKLSATILVVSLLCYSTVTTACSGCLPYPTPLEEPHWTPQEELGTAPPEESAAPPMESGMTPPMESGMAPPEEPCLTPPEEPHWTPPQPHWTPPHWTPPEEFCPRDVLKLGVCANLLGLIPIAIGPPPSYECCAVLKGLVDLEAAVCLCTAIKANVLGINLDVPFALSLLVSACQKEVPPGFECI